MEIDIIMRIYVKNSPIKCMTTQGACKSYENSLISSLFLLVKMMENYLIT